MSSTTINLGIHFNMKITVFKIKLDFFFYHDVTMLCTDWYDIWSIKDKFYQYIHQVKYNLHNKSI